MRNAVFILTCDLLSLPFFGHAQDDEGILIFQIDGNRQYRKNYDGNNKTSKIQIRMKHTYKISGMTGDHCVDTVKQALEGIKGIESAEVTLDPPRAEVTMQHHISETVMYAALEKAGNYQLKTMTGAKHKEHGQNQPEKDSTPSCKKTQHDHSVHAGQDGSSGEKIQPMEKCATTTTR